MSLNELSRFNKFDTDVYFKALVAVAKTDGEYKGVELEYLSDQARLFDYNLSNLLATDVKFDQIDFGSVSQFTKNIIIRDCISLAYIDGDYCAKERSQVSALASHLGLDPTNIEAIEKWLLDYWDILERGEKVMSS